MELGQKAALYPDMWKYIIHFSKSFKILNSPTWICPSAYLRKDSLINARTNTAEWRGSAVSGLVSNVYKVYALTVLIW